MKAKAKPFTMIPPPPHPIPALLSVGQLAVRLGVSQGQVYRRARTGEWESEQVDGSLRFKSTLADAILSDRQTITKEAAAVAS